MWPPIDFAVFIHHEGMEAKLKRKKTKCFSVPNSKTNPTRAGWPKRARLGLVRATQWADFTVITDQLWSTIVAIFSCVALSCQDCSLPLIFVYYCQPQKKPNWISVKLLRAFGHFVSQQRFLVPRIGTILFASIPSFEFPFLIFFQVHFQVSTISTIASLGTVAIVLELRFVSYDCHNKLPLSWLSPRCYSYVNNDFTFYDYQSWTAIVLEFDLFRNMIVTGTIVVTPVRWNTIFWAFFVHSRFGHPVLGL